MAPASAVKHYTVEKASVGRSEGRYASKSGPAAAAKKAASKRLAKKDGATMTLTLRELGSARVFSYTATRKKLAKPVERVIAGKKIVSEFETVVEAAKATKTNQTKKQRGGGGEEKVSFEYRDTVGGDRVYDGTLRGYTRVSLYLTKKGLEIWKHSDTSEIILIPINEKDRGDYAKREIISVHINYDINPPQASIDGNNWYKSHPLSSFQGLQGFEPSRGQISRRLNNEIEP